ncbi:hypothetical protein D3C80_1562740 [compost metagenome]
MSPYILGATQQPALVVKDHDHALASDFLSDLGDQLRVFQGCRTDRNLFHTQADDLAGLLGSAYTATIAKRHAAFGGQVGNTLVVGLCALYRSVDIQHHQLVSFLLVEDFDCVDRVADVFRVLEADGLYQTAILNQ